MSGETFSPTMLTLTIVLLVLVLLALLLVAGLYTLRAYRKKQASKHGLPMYNDNSTSRSGRNRRLTITATSSKSNGTRSSVFIINEKQQLIESNSAPPSPGAVPEIRITFPDEVDQSGRRKSGGVVVVHVGENGIGLQPLEEDPLPPYQQSDSERFQSLDLDRIGGLKEREAKETRWV